VIAGNYFGFDPSKAMVTPYTPNYWISDNGFKTLIGVDHSYSSNPAVSIMKNVFLPASLFTIRVQPATGIISGNWFGYLADGSSATLTAPMTGFTIGASGMDGSLIGTNGDGVGDDLERNWFGCTSQESIVQSNNGQNNPTIAGNYFGYATAGQTAPATAISPACRPLTFMFLSVGSIVGNVIE